MTLIYHAGLCCFCSSSVLVYGSVDTAAQCLLTLHNPEGCPVLCLKHSSRFLFAGLRNGTMMVYGRSSRGKVPPRLLCFQTGGCSFCCSSQREVCRGRGVKCTIVPWCFFKKKKKKKKSYLLANVAKYDGGWSRSWFRMQRHRWHSLNTIFGKHVVTLNESCHCYCVWIPTFNAFLPVQYNHNYTSKLWSCHNNIHFFLLTWD